MTSTNNNVNMNDLPALVPIDDAPIAPPKPLFAPIQPWTGPRPKIDIKVTSAANDWTKWINNARDFADALGVDPIKSERYLSEEMLYIAITERGPLWDILRIAFGCQNGRSKSAASKEAFPLNTYLYSQAGPVFEKWLSTLDVNKINGCKVLVKTNITKFAKDPRKADTNAQLVLQDFIPKMEAAFNFSFSDYVMKNAEIDSTKRDSRTRSLPISDLMDYILAMKLDTRARALHIWEWSYLDEFKEYPYSKIDSASAIFKKVVVDKVVEIFGCSVAFAESGWADGTFPSWGPIRIARVALMEANLWKGSSTSFNLQYMNYFDELANAGDYRACAAWIPTGRENVIRIIKELVIKLEIKGSDRVPVRAIATWLLEDKELADGLGEASEPYRTPNGLRVAFGGADAPIWGTYLLRAGVVVARALPKERCFALRDYFFGLGASYIDIFGVSDPDILPTEGDDVAPQALVASTSAAIATLPLTAAATTTTGLAGSIAAVASGSGVKDAGALSDGENAGALSKIDGVGSNNSPQIKAVPKKIKKKLADTNQEIGQFLIKTKVASSLNASTTSENGSSASSSGINKVKVAVNKNVVQKENQKLDGYFINKVPSQKPYNALGGNIDGSDTALVSSSSGVVLSGSSMDKKGKGKLVSKEATASINQPLSNFFKKREFQGDDSTASPSSSAASSSSNKKMKKD